MKSRIEGGTGIGASRVTAALLTCSRGSVRISRAECRELRAVVSEQINQLLRKAGPVQDAVALHGDPLGSVGRGRIGRPAHCAVP